MSSTLKKSEIEAALDKNQETGRADDFDSQRVNVQRWNLLLTQAIIDSRNSYTFLTFTVSNIDLFKLTTTTVSCSKLQTISSIILLLSH